MVFILASWFFYRSVLKNQLLAQFILAGILSTLWALVELTGGDAAARATATAIFAFILRMTAHRSSAHTRFYSLEADIVLGVAGLMSVATSNPSQSAPVVIALFLIYVLWVCGQAITDYLALGTAVVLAVISTYLLDLTTPFWILVLNAMAGWYMWATRHLIADKSSRRNELLSAVGSGAAIIAFGFAWQYYGKLVNLPLLLAILPVTYLAGNYYFYRRVAWRLALFYALGLLGTIVQMKSISDLHTWSVMVWWSGWTMSVLLLSLKRFGQDTNLDRQRTDQFYAITLAVSLVVLNTSAHNFPAGDFWRLILTAAGIGLAYLGAAKYTTRSDKYLTVSGLWVVWWWVLADHWRLTDVQWVIQPLLYYATIWSWWHWRSDQSDQRQNYAILVAVLLAASAYCWLEASIVEMALITGLFIFACGYKQREKIWRWCGAGILVLAVYLEVADFIWGIPWWVWLAVVGSGLLITATYLSTKKPLPPDSQ